jgi:hypothetical protein
MRGIAGVAVALGVIGIVLAIVALVKAGDSGFDEQTLQLVGGKETRIEFKASATSKGNPLGSTAWSSNSAITGDRTGEYVRTCIPVPTNEIDCSGSFLLEDGDVEVDLTEEANPGDAESDGAIIGGTRAYDGAIGSFEVDWKKDTFTLNLKLPQ